VGRTSRFKFGPRLNAAGRLADPILTLQLLRARSPVDARMLAGRIEQLNDERKAVERAVTEQAVAQARTVYGDHPTSGIVVAERGWHRGVVGISAARLVERFGVPAVVIAVDEAGVGHGSGRTPDGYHLHDAFSACRGDLLKFGGHAMAAGLSMNEARLDALRAGFAAATPRRDHTRPLPLVDVEVGDTFALPSAADLQGLEPLGEGNLARRLRARGACARGARGGGRPAPQAHAPRGRREAHGVPARRGPERRQRRRERRGGGHPVTRPLSRRRRAGAQRPGADRALTRPCPSTPGSSRFAE
jgi:single-stranded-DNA-specific exonuclease